MMIISRFLVMIFTFISLIVLLGSCGHNIDDELKDANTPVPIVADPAADNHNPGIPTPLPVASPGTISESEFSQQVLLLTNEFRHSQGVAPLVHNPQLAAAAQGYAESMGALVFFSHTSPAGDGPGDRIGTSGYNAMTWGENIARGQRTPQAVVTSWINSPGHRANMLNARFKDLGVGYATGPSGPYWVQDFGAE